MGDWVTIVIFLALATFLFIWVFFLPNRYLPATTSSTFAYSVFVSSLLDFSLSFICVGYGAGSFFLCYPTGKTGSLVYTYIYLSYGTGKYGRATTGRKAARGIGLKNSNRHLLNLRNNYTYIEEGALGCWRHYWHASFLPPPVMSKLFFSLMFFSSFSLLHFFYLLVH